MNIEIKRCEECDSDFYNKSSNMMTLCPECSHYLYGYEDCNHSFQNGRCTNCYWNGESSEFIKKLKN